MVQEFPERLFPEVVLALFFELIKEYRRAGGEFLMIGHELETNQILQLVKGEGLLRNTFLIRNLRSELVYQVQSLFWL